MYELALPPRPRKTPAYQWLYESLRAEILAGRLSAGTRLPSSRDLARQYGLSRGTIVNAFEQLANEGYVEGTIGAGTFVRCTLPDDMFSVDANAGRAMPAHPPRRFSAYGKRVQAFPSFDPPRIRAFRTDMPALDLFPTTLWAQVAARRLRRVSAKLLLGCDAIGYRPLREAIAAYLNTSRGVRCTADQVIVVTGVQHALDLVARLFLDEGDRACVEDPGYPGAAITFESFGAKVCALPLDDEGIVLRRRQLERARLVYVTPAHQFPVGTAMSLERRLELLDWARTSGALLFEDDYDSEFRFSGRPIPALQGLDQHGVVLFSGSFSKVLFPSLRLGYLVVPQDLVDKFAAAMSITTRHPPVLDQAVLSDFIDEGHFARHLRRMRQIYGERLAVLMEEGRRHLDGLLEISDVEAGMQTAAWLREGITADAATAAAAKREVDVTPLNRFTRGRMQREGLQLGFAAFDAREIRRGVRELAAALAKVAATS